MPARSADRAGMIQRKPLPCGAIHDLVRVAGVAWLAVPAVSAEPFLVRNQNPVLALYGLPSPLPARLPTTGSGRMAAVVNWSNAASTEATDRDSYTLDGEVVEARVYLDRALGARVAVRAELAWRQLDAGTLDGFIVNWHDAFGLPDGSRGRLPEDQFLIEYRANDTVRLRVDQGVSGIADVPIALGYQLRATDRYAFGTWLTVKAPVGNVEDFTGSGAADAALTFAAESHLAPRWQVFGQASVVLLGEGDLLPELQEDFAWSALTGVTWNAWRGLDITAQLAANSRLFDGGGTDLDGDAVVLTFGGTYRTTAGWHYDLSVSEDVEVSASPDVSFNFALRRRF